MESATEMRSMFYDAKLFNQDLSRWNTSKVGNFENTFKAAVAFNANLTLWNT
jgi:surface protein